MRYGTHGSHLIDGCDGYQLSWSLISDLGLFEGRVVRWKFWPGRAFDPRENPVCIGSEASRFHVLKKCQHCMYNKYAIRRISANRVFTTVVDFSTRMVASKDYFEIIF